MDTYNLFTGIFCVRLCENKKANVLFTGKSAFYSKICVFNKLLGPKNWSYYFDINLSKIFLAHENRFLTFVTLDNSKTIGQVYLFTEEVAFFQKISVFNNLLGPEEVIL